jgi:hypothetical protein
MYMHWPLRLDDDGVYRGSVLINSPEWDTYCSVKLVEFNSLDFYSSFGLRVTRDDFSVTVDDVKLSDLAIFKIGESLNFRVKPLSRVSVNVAFKGASFNSDGTKNKLTLHVKYSEDWSIEEHVTPNLIWVLKELGIKDIPDLF